MITILFCKLKKRFHEKETELYMIEEAKLKIADEGYDPEYGARPLRRALQKHVEDRLSEELLRGTVLTGGSVIVDVENGEFVVKTSGKEEREEVMVEK